MNQQMGQFSRLAKAWRVWDTRVSLYRPLSAIEKRTRESISTIVVPLGPYRNLTTLTAAIFALHPNAIVLNHAGARMWSDAGVDIFGQPLRESIPAFVETAVRFCTGGEKGAHGGSILNSHAFDDRRLTGAYQKLYGNMVLKPSVHVLFWKESMRITNRIIDNRIEWSEWFAEADEIGINVKLLAPMRNPIDCAHSNLRTGHWRHIGGADEFTSVLDGIVGSWRMCRDIALQHPERMLMFREVDLTADGFYSRLADYVGLRRDESWITSCREVVAVRDRKRSDDDIRTLKKCLLRQFPKDPEFSSWILEMVE